MMAIAFGYNGDGKGRAAFAGTAKANGMNSPDPCDNKLAPAALGLRLMPGYYLSCWC